MLVSGQDRFSPRELRAFYLCLTGLVVLSFTLLYGIGFFWNGNEDLSGRIRMLMLNSWWMVVSGIVTYGAAYMIAAFLFALTHGVAQPLKPTRRAVFVFALIFGLIHSFRLARGGDLLFDFIVIFSKDLLGIVLLALAATSLGSIKLRIYRKEERG